MKKYSNLLFWGSVVVLCLGIVLAFYFAYDPRERSLKKADSEEINTLKTVTELQRVRPFLVLSPQAIWQRFKAEAFPPLTPPSLVAKVASSEYWLGANNENGVNLCFAPASRYYSYAAEWWLKDGEQRLVRVPACKRIKDTGICWYCVTF